MASVTLTEFARRLFELGAPDEEVWQVLADYEMTVSAVISVDAAIAKAAVEVTRQTPQRLPLVDALIAATARNCDACCSIATGTWPPFRTEWCGNRILR